MNSRHCERVNGLQVVLRGYASMAAELAGAQWNEGDVFCSVVRRVALPDAFFAIDGQIETFLTVLDEFGAYPAVIQRELDRYLPFLATTRILIAAVRAASAARPRTRSSRSTPSRLRWRCANGAEPTFSTGLPRIPGCRWIGLPWMPHWPTRARSPGRRIARSTRSSRPSSRWWPYPEAAKYASGAIL